MNISLILHEAILFFSLYFPVVAPIIAIVFLFLRPSKQIRLFLFLLGFQGFFVDIGLTVNLPRIILLLMFVTLFAYAPDKLSRGLRNYPAKAFMFLFLLFVTLSILINLPFYPPKTAFTSMGPFNDDLFRGQVGRSFSQLAMLLLRASVPIIIIAFAHSEDAIKKLMKWLIAGTTTLCAYGFYQYVAYYAGLPALYIFRGSFRPAGDVGMFKTPWGAKILRMSSLAGEPKDLASILLPIVFFLGAMSLWYFIKRKKTPAKKRYLVWSLFAIHVVSFTLTFSTAAWIAGIAASVGIIIFFIKNFSFSKTLAVVFVTMILFVTVVKLYPKAGFVVKNRLTDRLTTKLLLDKSYGVPQLINLYKVRPHTMITGASFGGALLYVNYNEQPESFVYYLLDLGFAGVSILIAFWATSYLGFRDQFRNHWRTGPFPLALICSIISTFIAVFFFPKLDIMMIAWVLLGMGVSFGLVMKERKIAQIIS